MEFNGLFLLSSFAGGIFGALIGANAAFIFTGIMTLVGTAILVGNGDASFLETVALGPIFGPHISFVGAVAAVAFGNKVGERSNSQTIAVNDLFSSLNQIKRVDVLLVGGGFGVLGCLLNTAFIQLAIPIDTIALTVYVCGLLCRIIILRKSVLVNLDKFKARLFTKGSLVYSVLCYSSIGFLFAYVINIWKIANLGWAISAVSLLFLYLKVKDFPVTHHVTLVAGYCVVASGNILLATIVGCLAGILGDALNAVTNKEGYSHLDMPAGIIALGSFIIFSFF